LGKKKKEEGGAYPDDGTLVLEPDSEGLETRGKKGSYRTLGGKFPLCKKAKN